MPQMKQLLLRMASFCDPADTTRPPSQFNFNLLFIITSALLPLTSIFSDYIPLHLTLLPFLPT